MSFTAVIFDLIGTTVIEKDPSILNQCFVQAFKDYGVTVDTKDIRSRRGQEKGKMMVELLSYYHHPTDLAEPVLESFSMHLHNNLNNFRLNEGAGDIINYLKEKKLRVGLGTGLPRDLFETILYHVGWNTQDFDYVGISDEIGKSRPDPDMLFDMMNKMCIRNEELLKVGDTVADIQEGKNAKVATAAILSGTQDEKEIVGAKPDFIIRSLDELKHIVG